MPARLEDIKWNLKPGGITYLTRDQWNLVMEKAMNVDEIRKAIQEGCDKVNDEIASAKRDPLLVEREKTHGSFKVNAEVWLRIHKAFYMSIKEEDMPASQQMAVGMILIKLARLSSTPHVKDHWLDIAGYAKLGAEACD